MNKDFRLNATFFTHPKKIKLQKRLGAEAVLSLLQLWGYVALYRPNGVLEGMDEEDICIAAGWQGDEQQYIQVLEELRSLEPQGPWYAVHDWVEHNEYAAHAPDRSEKAKKAARKRHGTDGDEAGSAVSDQPSETGLASNVKRQASNTGGSTLDAGRLTSCAQHGFEHC